MWKVLTAANGTVLSVEDLADFIRVSCESEDSQLGQLIEAATVFFENRTRRVLLESKILATYPSFGCYVDVPIGVASAIDSIEYLRNGSYVAMDSSDYALLTGYWPGRIHVKVPPPADIDPESHKVTYIAGEKPAEVDPGIKHAVRLIASHFYEQRIPVAMMTTMAQVPFTLQALIDQYRIIRT